MNRHGPLQTAADAHQPNPPVSSPAGPVSGGRWVWIALSLTLACGAVLVHLGSDGAVGKDATTIDWQPALAFGQPWRAWTAAFVHYSPLHLAANLAGALAVAAWGAVSRVPARTALAWFIAWPLTHLALLAQPELRHYGGLSGVLHAGVTAVAVQVLFNGTSPMRRIAGAVLAVLAIKLMVEAPAGTGVITRPPGWDIAVAPGAHVAGALVGAAVSGVDRDRPSTGPGPARSTRPDRLA